MSEGFLDCLKRDRVIRIKSKFSGGKTGFRCIAPLSMLTAISPGQWQPWTAVSALFGLISYAELSEHLPNDA